MHVRTGAGCEPLPEGLRTCEEWIIDTSGTGSSTSCPDLGCCTSPDDEGVSLGDWCPCAGNGCLILTRTCASTHIRTHAHIHPPTHTTTRAHMPSPHHPRPRCGLEPGGWCAQKQAHTHTLPLVRARPHPITLACSAAWRRGCARKQASSQATPRVRLG